MWQRHWNLNRDPFHPGPEFPFVPTATHSEALARLIHVVEAGERRADLRALAGLGKSRVLAEALRRLRTPERRVALASVPGSTAHLLRELAGPLGTRVAPEARLEAAWRTLAEAVRLARCQGQGVVLAVDDDRFLDHPEGRRDLQRLAHLDPHPEARVTLLVAGRPIGTDMEPAEESELDLDSGSEPGVGDDWALVLRLDRLTRSEAEQYLSARLSAAGRSEPAFTPRAMVRLHALSRGVPRGLDRLAGLALLAGALRGLEIITPEVVEDAGQECWATRPVLGKAI
ncbi:hypothetical protein BH23PLA1_BH23PLA1_25150 [soil metagenome]